MRLKGSISIYFTLCIVLIISIILSVTELARYNTQRLNLQIATDASIDSMLSLYHRKLCEYYNVYGVEYRNDELLNKEYFAFLCPFFADENNGRKIANWYNAYICEEKINLKHKDLVDETYFEQEILEYMKYALIGKSIDYFGKEINIVKVEDVQNLLNEAKEVFNETKKTEIYSELYDRYFDFTIEIKSLETCEKTILTNIKDANNEMDALSKISTSGSLNNLKDVEKKIKKLKGDISTLITNLNKLSNKADEFERTIEKKRELYLEDKNSGKYSFDVDIEDFVESEFNEFESYVLPGSHMRNEIDKGKNEVEAIAYGFDTIVNNIDEYILDLDDIESEIKDAKKAKGDEYDPDLIHDLNEEKKDIEEDVSEYLKDVKESFKDIMFSDLDFDISKNDHTNEENLLYKLIDFKNSVLLDYVFTNEKIAEFSNETIRFLNHNISTNTPYISLDKILLNEYALDKFNYYGKKERGEITKSNSENYEVERIIAGRNTDKENISGTITNIFLIRCAMNMLYIFKNQSMRQEVRAFSYAIFGGFSRLLAEAMFLVCITAWGSAQSIIDLKRLVNGQKVNFMHNTSSWSVDIQDILSIAKGNMINVDVGDDDAIAITYKDYLRLLLLNINQSMVNSRMAEIMEKNICDEEENFDFEKLIAAIDVDNEFVSTHYFTNFIFVKAKDVILKDEYTIKTNGYKSFIK